MIGTNCYAWVRVLCVNKGKGFIGTEHIGGTHDGLLSKVNSNQIRKQFRDKIKQANRKFPVSDDNTFNFVVMTYDHNILLSVNTLRDVLYGSTFFEIAPNQTLYERLSSSGIWSQRVFTKTDILFVFDSGIDMLQNVFKPYVFVNPFNRQKVRTIPSPFNKMKCDVPNWYFSGSRKLS
jgi:hypothetical protein